MQPAHFVGELHVALIRLGLPGQRETQEEERNGKRCSYRCHLDSWLNEIMGIEGVPIPYDAPNASPTRTLSCKGRRQAAAFSRTSVPSKGWHVQWESVPPG